MDGSGRNLIMHEYSGNLKIQNLTGANEAHIHMSGGNIEIDATCTAGDIYITGADEVTDNSDSGCNVQHDSLIEEIADASATAVWLHTDAVFLAKIIKNKKILKKTGAVWELIIYDDDDSTPILQKDLKDFEGNNITDVAAGDLAQELKTNI